jgi:hypothetical protein
MKAIVVIDAKKKEYKRFVNKEMENHIFSDDLLTGSDVELFRSNPIEFISAPDNAA